MRRCIVCDNKCLGCIHPLGKKRVGPGLCNVCAADPYKLHFAKVYARALLVNGDR